MSTNSVNTTPKKNTQGSQVPSPKKVAKKIAPAEGEPEKKLRKPTLKDKHSRFLVSNYSLIQFLSSKGLITDEAVESAYSEIKLLAPVEEQEAFYESYITESKTTKKAMTQFIKARNKPPKAPKKTRTPKYEGKTTPKKSRAKKNTTVANDTNIDVVAQATAASTAVDGGASDLVNELTAAAIATPSTPEKSNPIATQAPGAPKKERKARPKKTQSDTKAPKETEKKSKNTKNSKEPETPIVQCDETEEIHTQEIEIAGKSYLIDGDNNIYSVDTHDEIGTYDAVTNTINAHP